MRLVVVGQVALDDFLQLVDVDAAAPIGIEPLEDLRELLGAEVWHASQTLLITLVQITQCG